MTLKEKQEETSDRSEEQGLAIKNEYAYVVAILLRQTTDEVVPDLNLLAVEPSQVNARNVINVTLQNPTATYLNSFRLINEVTKKVKATASILLILLVCRWHRIPISPTPSHWKAKSLKQVRTY